MLVSAKKMIDEAVKGKYAIGHFNINNLEWTKAILEVAQETQTPVILGVSMGAGKYMTGLKTVKAMVSAMVESMNITVPVSLHLDHGNYEWAKEAIEVGFNSVMFDGSHLPLEENLAKTKEIVELAKAKGVSVESEVGSIGGEEDGIIGNGEIADPEDCQTLVNLGIDFLAAGIGNIHGVYPENWAGLNFDALAAIQKKIGNNMGIVLHGASGIPDEQVTKAISLGIAKINVNTECQIVFAKAIREYIEEGKDKENKGFDPRKLLKPGMDAVKTMVKEKMELFGSLGKAKDSCDCNCECK